MNSNPVQKLRNQITSEIEVLERKIKEKKSVNLLVQTRCSINAIKSIVERLDRIEQLLQIPSYDLIFIGKIGVGKTTAICRLFDLICEEEKAGGKKGKTIKLTDELFSTGSGRTTICEVIIQPSQSIKSFFEIEPYSQEEVEDYVKEFCTYFWNNAHNQNLKTQNLKTQDTPAELVRAIRNIADLPEKSKVKENPDKALKYAKKYSKFDDFLQFVLERASLSLRNQTRLEVLDEFETTHNEKKWLQDNFSDLNLGKVNGFSLPKKIRVYLSNKILDFGKYPRFQSIIDTRGLDEAKDRKDLSEYIRNRDNAICLFAENFNAAPSNYEELLKKYLIEESKDIDTKLSLLVLTRNREPENVFASDGKVENREEGIEIRTDQIRAAFANQKIKFVPQNILFYDALQYYDYYGKQHILKSSYDEDNVVEDNVICDRNNVLKSIDNIIERRKNKLLEDVKNCAKQFEDIKSSGGFSSDEKKSINDLKKTIENHRESRFLSDFENKYKAHLKSYHPSTFRAINNRRGRYTIRGIDIYFDASSVLEEVLRNKLIESKANIVGAIEGVEESYSNNSSLISAMQILKEKVDKHFSEIVIEIGQEVTKRMEEILRPTYFDEFWDYVQQRWGQGSGYVVDVLERYVSEIYGIDDWLTERVQELWEQNFLNNILEFFGEE